MPIIQKYNQQVSLKRMKRLGGPEVFFEVSVRVQSGTLDVVVLTIYEDHTSKYGQWWYSIDDDTRSFIEKYIKDNTFVNLWSEAGEDK